MTERLFTPVQKNTSDSLSQLLLAANMVEPERLSEAQEHSKRMDVPLQTVLVMLKAIAEINLRPALRANEMMSKGKIDLDLAVRALQLSRQNSIEFDDALDVMGAVISKSQQMPSVANALVELLLASGLLNIVQAGQVIKQAGDTQNSVGSTLIINRFLTHWALQEALTAQSLVKESKITRRQAEQALRTAMNRRVSVLQVLFERGEYTDCAGESLKLAELAAMAGLLSEREYVNCMEIHVCEDKQFGQVMLEQKLVTMSLLEAAFSILDMVGSYLKPFQAAQALRQVKAKGVSVYQAIAELQPPPQLPQRQISLGELVIESGIVSKAQMAGLMGSCEESPIKVGKRLMAANLMTEACLYKVLRCHSLLKEGLLSVDQALAVMASCRGDSVNIEEALSQGGFVLPVRMHWSWM